MAGFAGDSCLDWQISQIGLEQQMSRTAYQWITALSYLVSAGVGAAEGDVRTTMVGGSGGDTPFTLRCDNGYYIAGLRVRLGDDVDAIGPICAQLRQDGSRGGLQAAQPSLGGNVGGGQPREQLCPADAPFVRRIWGGMDGSKVHVLNGVYFLCAPIQGPAPSVIPSINSFSFVGPYAEHGSGWDNSGQKECASTLALVGLYGRAGYSLDAFGAICGRIAAAAVPRSTQTIQQATPRVSNPAAQATRASATDQSVRSSTATPVAGNAALTQRIQELDSNLLICRGGTGINPQPTSIAQDGSRSTTFVFSPAIDGAGADGSSLHAGSCGFATRKWNMADPPAVLVTLTAQEAEANARLGGLENHLRNADNYWSFTVENSGRGYFTARHNAKWLGDKTLVRALPAEERHSKCATPTAIVSRGSPLEQRMERIRCEHALLDAARAAALDQKIADVVAWLNAQP